MFTYELLFENTDFIEYKNALESRKDTSMPARAGFFFDMFPFCILFEVSALFYSYFLQDRVVQPVWRSYGMARHLKWRSLIEVLEV
mgnify:CR=1 FL=1